jgi:hypothetical protein
VSVIDAGVTDAGVTDAGVTDAGVTDAGVTDAGVTDAGVFDAAVFDASVFDTSVFDASVFDTSVFDASVFDTSVFDTSVFDASALDSVALDTMIIDTQSPDSGSVPDVPTADNTISCNNPESLKDDFDDGVFGTGWNAPQVYSGASAQESSGVLQLSPATTRTYIRSALVYNFSEATVSVEVTETLSLIANADTCLILTDSASTRMISLCQSATNLHASYHTPSGTVTTIATVAYSSVNHRFWRLRNASGTTLWEFSADGITYSLLGSASIPFALDHLSIQLSAAYWSSGNPGVAKFDNLNGAGAGMAVGCALTTLKDNFADEQLLPLWVATPGPGTAVESGGVLTLAPPVNGTGMASVTSDEYYRLTDGSITVKIAEMVNVSTTAVAELVVKMSNDKDFLLFRQDRGTLRVLYAINYTETSVASLSYVQGTHVYWRISENSGIISWATSADGNAWNIMGSASPGFSTEAFRAIFTSSIWESATAPGKVSFDDVNILP